MKSILIPINVVMCVLALLMSASVFAEDHPAMALVKKTTDAIMTQIKEKDEAIKKDQEVLYDLVSTIVLPHFDFRKMSSWVLGKNWRKANKDQQQKFTDQFSRLLVRTYSKALQDNTDKKVEYMPIRGKPKADDVVIRTEIPQKGGFPIPIDYKMHLKNNEWKVYDVVIDSLSLVANYRTSFNQEIKKSGIDTLIAKLANRNEELETKSSPKKK